MCIRSRKRRISIDLIRVKKEAGNHFIIQHDKVNAHVYKTITYTKYCFIWTRFVILPQKLVYVPSNVMCYRYHQGTNFRWFMRTDCLSSLVFYDSGSDLEYMSTNSIFEWFLYHTQNNFKFKFNLNNLISMIFFKSTVTCFILYVKKLMEAKPITKRLDEMSTQKFNQGVNISNYTHACLHLPSMMSLTI